MNRVKFILEEKEKQKEIAVKELDLVNEDDLYIFSMHPIMYEKNIFPTYDDVENIRDIVQKAYVEKKPFVFLPIPMNITKISKTKRKEVIQSTGRMIQRLDYNNIFYGYNIDKGKRFKLIRASISCHCKIKISLFYTIDNGNGSSSDTNYLMTVVTKQYEFSSIDNEFCFEVPFQSTQGHFGIEINRIDGEDYGEIFCTIIHSEQDLEGGEK